VPPFAVMHRVVELPEPTGRSGEGKRLPSRMISAISDGAVGRTTAAGPADETIPMRLRATAVFMSELPTEA
jgi:hypothetical protein